MHFFFCQLDSLIYVNLMLLNQFFLLFKDQFYVFVMFLAEKIDFLLRVTIYKVIYIHLWIATISEITYVCWNCIVCVAYSINHVLYLICSYMGCKLRLRPRRWRLWLYGIITFAHNLNDLRFITKSQVAPVAKSLRILSFLKLLIFAR